MSYSAESLIRVIRAGGDIIYFGRGSWYAKDGVVVIFNAIGMAPPFGTQNTTTLANILGCLTVDGGPVQVHPHFTAVLRSCLPIEDFRLIFVS